MNLFDKLLGLGLTGDLTDTTWWNQTVCRGLQQEDLDEPSSAEADATAGPSAAEMT